MKFYMKASPFMTVL